MAMPCKISDDYEQHSDDIWKVLSEFKPTWYGHLGQVVVTQHSTKLLLEYMRPVYTAPYRAGLKLIWFGKSKITNIFNLEEVIEPPQGKLPSAIVFTQIMDGTLRICVDYWLVNTVTMPDSDPIPRMDECILSFGIATIL